MLAALFLSLVPLSDPEQPDLVVLMTGAEVECRVLFEDDEEVVYRAGKKEQRVPRSDVKSVQSLERSLAEFLSRLEPLSPTDTLALTGMAVFAEQTFLPGEARNLWLRILALDPENAQGWTKLGGVQGRKGWQLQVHGRFYGLEELRARVSDWKNALELTTAHFLLRTDADPLRALDASLDVERAYQAFYEIVGRPLKLFVFDERPEIHVFSDSKDYPTPPSGGQPGGGQKVWFSPQVNALYVNASAQPTPAEVVSELTQLLIFNAFRRSTDTKTGEIEPWARQGLMSAFALAVRPDPGRVRFEFAPPHRPWFEREARDEKPLDLRRILTAGRGAFEAGTDVERYTTGAYTLVHFLAFYQEGKYRAGLARFLRDSFQGQGGKTRFLENMGAEEDALEGEWRAYVQALGGP